MKVPMVIPGGIGVALAALAWCSVSRGDETAPVSPQPPAATAAPPAPAPTAPPPPAPNTTQPPAPNTPQPPSASSSPAAPSAPPAPPPPAPAAPPPPAANAAPPPSGPAPAPVATAPQATTSALQPLTASATSATPAASTATVVPPAPVPAPAPGPVAPVAPAIPASPIAPLPIASPVSLPSETSSDPTWHAPRAALAPTEAGASSDATNGALIGAGLFVLASSYLPAIAVAESSNTKPDDHLYVPIAGPWLDLVHRPSCNATDCSAEFGNRALIATDGLLQGLGAFMTLVGLLAIDEDSGTPVAKNTEKTTVHLSPAQLGSGSYGVRAFGTF